VKKEGIKSENKKKKLPLLVPGPNSEILRSGSRGTVVKKVSRGTVGLGKKGAVGGGNSVT